MVPKESSETNAYKFIGFGDTHGPKPYKFIGFGDSYGPKPYKFMGFGDSYGPKPYKFIGPNNSLGRSCSQTNPRVTGAVVWLRNGTVWMCMLLHRIFDFWLGREDNTA